MVTLFAIRLFKGACHDPKNFSKNKSSFGTLVDVYELQNNSETMNYKIIPKTGTATGDYMGLHGITWGWMVLHWITWDYRGLQGISWDYWGFHGITADFMGLLRITGDFMELQGVTQSLTQINFRLIRKT